VDEEANEMFNMGAETMALPMEEKMKFEQGDGGQSFGFVGITRTQHLVECYYSYKAKGANAVDPTGKPDNTEFLNIAKDDAIAWPQQARRGYPSTANARMESTITPFVRKSMEVNYTLFQIFEEKLGLPAGALVERHSLEEFSGSEARIIRTSPSPSSKESIMGIGAHTDFGSLVVYTHSHKLSYTNNSTVFYSRFYTIVLEDCKSLLLELIRGNMSRFSYIYNAVQIVSYGP
jgi:isopenicillin N synthase-like dioxygenase